jgi:phosphatidylglycerol:prolipoprotein diacylglycerol transferase
MHPILIQIGSFSLKSYWVFMALGFVLGGIVIYWQAKRKNLDPHKTKRLILITIISGFIGSRILYVFLNFGLYQKNLLRIFKFWKGGLSWQGGFLFNLLVMLLILRSDQKNLGKWLDTGILGILIGHSIGRIGCFLNGCCYGITTNIPWAIQFSNLGDNLLRHPTQLYESFGYFVIFLLLYFCSKNIYPNKGNKNLKLITQKSQFPKKIQLKNGSLFFIGSFLHSFTRFIVEYFRYNKDFIYQGSTWYTTVSYAQLTALFIMIFSIFILLKINYSKKN